MAYRIYIFYCLTSQVIHICTVITVRSSLFLIIHNYSTLHSLTENLKQSEHITNGLAECFIYNIKMPQSPCTCYVKFFTYRVYIFQ